MDLGASRLLISLDEANALLEAQIIVGENLLEEIASASVITDLAPVRDEMSAWSARNEAVLARAFGASVGQRYRLGTGAAVAVQGFGRRQAEMARRVKAGLRRLRSTAATLDLVPATPPPTRSSEDGQVTGKENATAIQPAGSGTTQTATNAAAARSGQPKKPWWRAAIASPWTVAIGAPLIVTMILAGIHFAGGTPAAGHSSLIVTGSVVCESGSAVAGVWIAASSGEADSGMADLGASGSSSRRYRPGSAATYTYLLRHGGSYSAHVGCGGTASHWALTNFSPLLSSATASLHCGDPVARPVDGVIPAGHCTVAAG